MKPENNETISIQFTGEELDQILEYQRVSESVTVQAAVMNAVSLALDHSRE